MILTLWLFTLDLRQLFRNSLILNRWGFLREIYEYDRVRIFPIHIFIILIMIQSP